MLSKELCIGTFQHPRALHTEYILKYSSWNEEFNLFLLFLFWTEDVGCSFHFFFLIFFFLEKKEVETS